MSEKVYIQDDYGNKVPLLDNYGNLSMQVIMLYAEDRLNETDRKTVDAFAATDEMSRDALDGYAKSANVSRTRHQLNELNTEIQRKTGAAPIPTVVYKESKTDYRKIAAGVAALIVIATGTYFTAQYFSKPELVDSTAVEETEAQEQQRQFFEPREEETAEAEEAPILEDVAEVADEVPKKEENALAGPVDAEVGNAEPVGKAKFRAVEKADESEKKKDKAQDAPTESVLAAKKETTPPPVTTADNKNAGAGAAEPVMELAKEKAASKTVEAQRKAEEEMAASKAAEAASRSEAKRMALEQNEMALKRQERQRQEYEKAEMLDDMQAERVAAESAAQENAAKEDRSQTAKYPGGDIAMYKFIEKKKVYTDDMRNQNIKGVVQVQFEISADGQVTNAKLKSSSNHAPFNEDALRVVNAMPKWKPAKNESGDSTSSTRTVVIKYGD